MPLYTLYAAIVANSNSLSPTILWCWVFVLNTQCPAPSFFSSRCPSLLLSLSLSSSACPHPHRSHDRPHHSLVVIVFTTVITDIIISMVGIIISTVVIISFK